MNRTRFSDRQLADMIMLLIGEIEPVGESHIDSKRFDNLLRLQNTIDILLDEIAFIVPYHNRPEYSMRKAAVQSARWLAEKRDWINNYKPAEEEHTMEEFMYGQEGNPNDGSM